jgi:hypothetical protein
MGGFGGDQPGGGGIQLPPLPPPVVTGGGSGTSASSVTSALGSIVRYIGSVLSYGQGYSNALLGGLESALKTIFSDVVSWFQAMAKSWLGQIIRSIYDKLKTIFQAVQKEIHKVLAIFQAYEKLVRYWEQRILGPVVNVVQALRKTLVIFKLFHLKFASQLDNYLSGIEGRLTNIFLFYQKELNKIIDYLDLIVDPFGLINEAMFIGSAVRSIGAVWAGVMGYPSTSISASQTAAVSTPTGFYSSHSQITYAKQLAAGGVPAEDQAINDSLREGYSQMGYSF